MDVNTPPPHPGQVLAKTISGYHINHVALCLGITTSTLQRVIRGDFRITPVMAYRLSIGLKIPMEYWMRLQMEWDMWEVLHDKNRPANVIPVFAQDEPQIPEQETIPFEFEEE